MQRKTCLLMCVTTRLLPSKITPTRLVAWTNSSRAFPSQRRCCFYFRFKQRKEWANICSLPWLQGEGELCLVSQAHLVEQGSPQCWVPGFFLLYHPTKAFVAFGRWQGDKFGRSWEVMHQGWESPLSAVLACHPVLASGTLSCLCAPALQVLLEIIDVLKWAAFGEVCDNLLTFILESCGLSK